MDYLPPIVIDVLGRDRDFKGVLAEVIASLRTVPDKKTVLFGADGRPLAAAVAEAEAELDALDARVVEPTIRPRVDYGDLGLLASARTTAGASAIASALGIALADRGAARGGGGLLNAIGFGSSRIPFLGAFAGFGTLASLLGFGAEHAAFTGLGVAGSAGAGLLGGGLLGLGAAGVAGVGMGTDLAGIGQAAGDIKTVNSDLSSLNQAIAQYGANSTQAAAAQRQLNADLGGFSPVARGAVLAAAQTAQQFKALFDQATGQAEKIGAQIIQQAMQTGEKFLPTIGKFAAQNMGIIQQQLQPFFDWLSNPSPSGGLGIFTDLEREFTQNLPTAMHALTQAFEFFARTVDVASHYTGGFTALLDRFFTKWNGADFSRWATEIGKLIGVFRVWLHFFDQLGHVIFDIFAPAVGAGTSIIKFLSDRLHDFDNWLKSAPIKSELHNLFSAHLQELIQGIGNLIKNLLPIAESFMSVFMQWSTQGAGLMTLILKPLGDFVKLVSSNAVTRTLAGWILMFGLIASKVGPLIALVGGLSKAWGGVAVNAGLASGAEQRASMMVPAELAGSAGSLAAGTDVGEAFAATAPGRFARIGGGLSKIGTYAQGAAGALGLAAIGAIGGSALAGATEGKQQRVGRDITTAGGGILGAGLGLMQVNPLIGGVVAGVGAVTMAAGEIVAHWKGVSKFFANDVWHPLRAGAIRFWHTFDNDIIHPIERLPGDLARWFSEGFGAVVRFFQQLPGRIMGFLKKLPYDLGYLVGEAIGFMVRVTIDQAKLIWAFWTDFVPHVLRLLAHLGMDLLKLGGEALHALWTGITSEAKDVWNFFTSLPGKIIGFITGLPGMLTTSGKSSVHGFWSGITAGAADIWNFFTSLPGKIIGFFKNAGSWLFNAGKSVIGGFVKGLGGGIVSGIGGALSSINPFAGGTAFAPGGLSLVGEHGPELMQVPWGASIIPARQTQRMLSAGGNQTNHFTLNAITNAPSQRLARDMVWEARSKLAGLVR